MPADVSVVGFDDRNFGAMWNPALTSYTQNFLDMGERIFRMLFEQIQASAPAMTRRPRRSRCARQAVSASLRTRVRRRRNRVVDGDVRINR